MIKLLKYFILFLFVLVANSLSCSEDDISPLAILIGKVNEGDYEGARCYWAQKYIKKKIKQDEYLLWALYINEEEEKGYLDSLKIVEYEWIWETQTGDYFYIRGRVKNIGQKTIRYYKIKLLFYKTKNGDVLDMNYTNSASLLRPGEAEKFDIMQKRDKRIKGYRLIVEEISLNR